MTGSANILLASLGGLASLGPLGWRFVVRPIVQQALNDKLRQNSISEMERNLALYEQAKDAKAQGARQHR